MKSTLCLSCTLPAQHADAVLSVLYECSLDGCEEIDKGAVAVIKAFFSASHDLERARSAFGRFPFEISVEMSTIEDQDWMAVWRASMKPAHLGHDIWVSPQWLKPSDKEMRHWIKIEPKMAFGTGHHETTRLAGSALIHALTTGRARQTVLDIGAGSGVLCFVADCCGSSLAVGIEIDTTCLDNIAENRTANPSRATVSFAIATCDAISDDARFDIIVMNMLILHAGPLIGRVRALAKHNGVFIWSGLLLSEKELAIRAAESEGFSLAGQSAEGEWWCGHFSAANT